MLASVPKFEIMLPYFAVAYQGAFGTKGDTKISVINALNSHKMSKEKKS